MTATSLGQNMGVLVHLQELRKRLLRSAVAIIIGIVVAWIFFEPIFVFLERPYCNWAEQNEQKECTFLITEVLEPFSVTLSISSYVGFILAMPVTLYQLARFVMPGLYPKEKRIVLPFVAVGIILFLLGAALSYYLMPKAIEVLFSFGPDNFVEELKAQGYVGFFIKMILAFGLAAELPLILVFLQKIGILSTSTLKNNRRIAIVAIFILGAVITPTGDPFILLAISIPMYILYEVAIFIGGRFAIQKKKLA